MSNGRVGIWLPLQIDLLGWVRCNDMQYHPTADTNGRSRVVGVPVYADWNAPFLFFIAFLAELY
jgi:hypothetical protein